MNKPINSDMDSEKLQKLVKDLVADLNSGEAEKLQKLVKDLVADLNSGEAKIVLKDGKYEVEYYPRKLKSVTPHCGKIANPKTNEKEVIESCLKIYNIIKTEGAPEGVLLDPTKISSSPAGTYKEGKDYEIMNEILGKGLYGDIVVVRDKLSKTDHALKTVMLALFNPNEIRVWVSLEGCENFPNLYMFNKTDGKIELHHEILTNAVTITDVINYRMDKLREHPNLLHHFSLYVLQGLLEASSTMHSKQWLHDDIHEENVMLQPLPESILKLRMIDFGCAKELKENVVVNDIHGIIRIFTSVYVTDKFNDVVDLQKNWEAKLNEHSETHKLSHEHKEELLSLVKLALDVKLTKDEEELKKTISKKLIDSNEKEPEILKNIAKLIFPEHFPSHEDSDVMEGGNVNNYSFQSCDSDDMDDCCVMDGGEVMDDCCVMDGPSVPDINYNVFVVGKMM